MGDFNLLQDLQGEQTLLPGRHCCLDYINYVGILALAVHILAQQTAENKRLLCSFLCGPEWPGFIAVGWSDLNASYTHTHTQMTEISGNAGVTWIDLDNSLLLNHPPNWNTFLI